MTSRDLDRFAEIMAAMAENYPGTMLTGAGLDMRFEALKEFSMDQVESAATNLIRTHRYNTMPTTADIINAMDGVASRITMEECAEIEAGKVLEHLRYFGKSVSPCFDDPITKHLMATRWRYLPWASTVTEADLKWWKVEFARSYLAHHAGVRAGYYFPAMNKIRQLARTAAKSLPVKQESIYGAATFKKGVGKAE